MSEDQAQETRWHFPPGGVPQRVTPMTREEWAREIVGDFLIKPDVDCDNIDLTSMVSAIATALEVAYQEGIQSERAMNELVKIGQEIDKDV